MKSDEGLNGGIKINDSERGPKNGGWTRGKKVETGRHERTVVDLEGCQDL